MLEFIYLEYWIDNLIVFNSEKIAQILYNKTSLYDLIHDNFMYEGLLRLF